MVLFIHFPGQSTLDTYHASSHVMAMSVAMFQAEMKTASTCFEIGSAERVRHNVMAARHRAPAGARPWWTVPEKAVVKRLLPYASKA